MKVSVVVNISIKMLLTLPSRAKKKKFELPIFNTMYVPEFSNESFFRYSCALIKILNINESTILKFNYSGLFVLSTTLIDKYECNEYEYNVDIELLLFEICLIHKPTLLDS